MTHRVAALVLALALVAAPALGQGRPEAHVRTVTATTPPLRIVWMPAKDYLRIDGERVRAVGAARRALDGLESCRRGRTDDAGDQKTITDACTPVVEESWWNDAMPWLVAGGIVGAFIGGVLVGIEAGSKTAGEP